MNKRYVVFKKKYLTQEQLAQLRVIMQQVDARALPNCSIVEEDWPEFAGVNDSIYRRTLMSAVEAELPGCEPTTTLRKWMLSDLTLTNIFQTRAKSEYPHVNPALLQKIVELFLSEYLNNDVVKSIPSWYESLSLWVRKALEMEFQSE